MQQWHKVSAAKDDKHSTSNVLWLPEMQAPSRARSETDTMMSQLTGNLPFPQCHRDFPSSYQEE